MGRKNQGFTLMEMLIVVAIIGILAAISIPVFTGAAKKAKEAACAANRRSAKGMIAVAAMTDDEFRRKFEADRTYDWDNVKTALKDAGTPFEDKICPENGEITVVKNGSGLSVFCAFHDKGASEIERSNWITNEKKGNEYLSSVSEEFKKKYGLSGDKDYFKGGGDDYAFMKMYNEYLKAQGGSLSVGTSEAAGYFPDNSKFKEEELYWTAVRVHFDGESHDIMLLTTKENVESADPKLRGYLFWYNGSYYRSTSLDYNKNVDSTYLVGGKGNKDKTLDELLADKWKTWEKVS